MSLSLKDAVLCSVFAVALPVGQMLFKMAAIANARLNGPIILRLLKNLPLMSAFAWYGITALFWFYVLTRVPLSTAYAFSMVGSALVPIMAWALFKESLNGQMAVGFVIILVGLVIVARARPA
ncbi:MAG: hypothetical protein CGW95_13765 [Phenylobacterium zucineum]|nr:MAG: hypothetical protein CGW95_13765 [Phenylobacterium zucineum]